MKRRRKEKSTLSNQTGLKRYRDIENGKVLPTLEEFYMLAIFFRLGENVNLKELYPTLYDECRKRVDIGMHKMKKAKGIPSSFWAW